MPDITLRAKGDSCALLMAAYNNMEYVNMSCDPVHGPATYIVSEVRNICWDKQPIEAEFVLRRTPDFGLSTEGGTA